MYKDIVKDFLLMFDFPTPTGKNCMVKDEAVRQAEALGYPVVVKPLAGHKGQGVTTGVANAEQVEATFQNIVDAAEAAGVAFEGAIVEKEVYGTDQRLLTVGGKFAAGIERVPAYVDGDGKHTIEELIAIENDREVRLDNARSPLAKIKIDDDLKDYLSLQNLTVGAVPKEGDRIYLRRVANISAGGVSINVTDNVHPKNVKLVEDIAKFFRVSVLGIDVLVEDISVPWNEGSFGIIEINAGPGVLMHLAPAIGGSIDVPGKIMQVHFPRPEYARIPIIADNRVSRALCDRIYADLRQIVPDVEFADVTLQIIRSAGHDLDTVLPGKKVLPLKRSGSLALGGSAVDVTDEVHPVNRFLAERAARVVGLNAAGVDVIAPTLRTSLLENNGCFIDYTTSTMPPVLEEGEIKCSRALKTCLERGVGVEQITFSSDGQGSLPVFDADNEMIGLSVGSCESLFPEVRSAVQDEGLPLETALRVITSNPAELYRLETKGRIAAGCDADLVLLDAEDLSIRTVIAMGRVMVRDGEVAVYGTFEKFT